MIEDAEVAREVSDLMQGLTSQLNRSVGDIMARCPLQEARIYRRAVGAIMAEILLEVLNPVYELHPSLKPPGFD